MANEVVSIIGGIGEGVKYVRSKEQAEKWIYMNNMIQRMVNAQADRDREQRSTMVENPFKADTGAPKSKPHWFSSRTSTEVFFGSFWPAFSRVLLICAVAIGILMWRLGHNEYIALAIGSLAAFIFAASAGGRRVRSWRAASPHEAFELSKKS